MRRSRAKGSVWLLSRIAPFVVGIWCARPASSDAAEPGCRVWSQSRCGSDNAAAIELSAPASRTPRAWNFDGSGGVWGYEPGMTTWSSPALAAVDGKVLVAAGSYDHTLYALDAASGELAWKFTTGGPVFSTPVFWNADGKTWCFVAANDRLVYALDASLGRQLWVHSVEEYRATLGGARLASPAVGRTADGEDAVFVPYWVWDRSIANNQQRAGVMALAARTGKPIWNRELGDNELTSAIVAESGGRRWLLLGSGNGVVLALDARDGREVWRQTELDAVRSPPAFVESATGPLVVMASKFGTVRGLHLGTGVERWRFKTGDRVTGSPAILGSGTDARVFVGSYDRTLYAQNANTGAVEWRYAARGGLYSSPALVSVGASPMVLVSGWDHMLHAVGLQSGSALFTAFTGRPLWNVAGLDESNWSSPAVARINGQWMAYVGSYDGTLRALPLDEADRTAPRLRSNLWFWLSFPIALTPVMLLAVYLTRRQRGEAKRFRPPTSRASATKRGAKKAAQAENEANEEDDE